MNTQYLLTVLLCPLIFTLNVLSLNLEDKNQDFISELIKIEIPQHPHAFNPSIVKWKDRIYICFREILEDDESQSSYYGIVQVNENFTVCGHVQFLNSQLNIDGLHDARLAVINDELFLIYSAECDFLPLNTSQQSYGSGKYGTCRMFTSKLHLENDQFFVTDTHCITTFEDENPYRSEKNWVPFDYNGNLFFGYSLTPHKILYPVYGSNAYLTQCNAANTIQWEYGELRGGTPGLLIDGQYIAFFHSSMYLSSDHSDNEIMHHYFMGAYTYSSSPPFEITSISPEPIVARGFYEGKRYRPYWHPVKVIFPYGLISDSDHLWVSYGRDDHEMWIAKINKQKLLKSLIPVCMTH